MFSHKTIDIVTNAECHCFLQDASQDRFFLSRKVSTEAKPKPLTFETLPSHVQLALGKNSIKKSLRRGKFRSDGLNAESP
jgi:hypothetical protein